MTLSIRFCLSGCKPTILNANQNAQIVQIIGYIARALSHSNTKSVPIYSIQTILILLAPPLYAASIYMVLGRLISHLRAESYSMVPLKWMTRIFVTGDVVAFVMQAAGMSHALPLAAYSKYSVITQIFYRRRNHGKRYNQCNEDRRTHHDWRPLCAASLLHILPAHRGYFP